ERVGSLPPHSPGLPTLPVEWDQFFDPTPTSPGRCGVVWRPRHNRSWGVVNRNPSPHDGDRRSHTPVRPSAPLSARDNHPGGPRMPAFVSQPFARRSSGRLRSRLAGAVAALLLLAPALPAQMVTPDQAADMLLTSAKNAY